MAVFSKESYRMVDHHRPCTLLHPWTTSCSYNLLTTFLLCIRGSSKFFFFIYLLQLLSKGARFQHVELEKSLISFCRSCIFGGFCGGTTMGCICFFRWALGRLAIPTMGLLPGFIGGAGIFIEEPTRRDTDITLYITFVINLYLKVFMDEGILKMTLAKEFTMFTICSSLLLYCLRVFRDSYTTLWPFTPHKVPEDPERRKHCSHKGSCLDDIKRSTTTFFTYGLILQCFKVMVVNFPKAFFKPNSFLKPFFNLKNLGLPLFAGLYVALFKGVSCLLCHLRKEDEAWHAIPAGLVASLSYLIQPNLSLALFALSNLSQIICRELRKKLELPKWYYKEIIFMICMGLLFHARAVYPQCFPSYMTTIMDTVTDGRSKVVYNLVDEHILIRL